MHRSLRFPSAALLLALFCALLAASRSSAQDSKVMGELKFNGATGVEKDAGVWIDGVYVGYIKELKGDKKVLLLPGKHQVTVRQSGYSDFVREVVVEPGHVQKVRVTMQLIPGARPPAVTAELKLTVDPGRAAVFLDDNYAGHAGEFGGALHSLLLSPGKHRIKVALPGYRTFETEVNLLAGQKSEVKTELVKGSIEQASSEIIKNQQ
ncbi:MAG TPA: PEGA domain-containing protein [Candidatus Dormibacteraeota bacterium]|nr:PEGA domain-containing protein [Candidatus Dormibacteraeota bacterium]